MMDGSTSGGRLADNRAIWGTTPTLGAVARERYLGRIWVEVFGEARRIVFTPAGTSDLKKRVLSALKRREFILEASNGIWPAESVLKGRREETYVGRAVIELWSTTTKVSISVGGGSEGAVLAGVARALTENRL